MYPKNAGQACSPAKIRRFAKGSESLQRGGQAHLFECRVIGKHRKAQAEDLGESQREVDRLLNHVLPVTAGVPEDVVPPDELGTELDCPAGQKVE
jgi:hypothetical protein